MRTDTERLDYFEKNSREFRYIADVSMDGKYPAWHFWSPKKGKDLRKTLREAIDAAMDDDPAVDKAESIEELKAIVEVTPTSRTLYSMPWWIFNAVADVLKLGSIKSVSQAIEVLPSEWAAMVKIEELSNGLDELRGSMVDLVLIDESQTQ